MEKRLFLAIGLSLLVVWLWSSVAPKPQPPPLSPKVLEKSSDKPEEDFSLKEPETPSKSEKGLPLNEKTDKFVEILDSGKLELEISNIGATIDQIRIKEYEISLPLEGILAVSGYENASFDLKKTSDRTIQGVYENEEIKITKDLSFGDDGYTLEVKIGVDNKTDMSRLIKLDLDSYKIEMSSLDNKGENADRIKMRDRSLNEYVINSEDGIFRKGGAFKFSDKERKTKIGSVFWSGFRDRYFCFIIKPQYETSGYQILPIDESSLKIKVESKEIPVQPGGNVQFESFIYAGPEKIEALKGYGMGFEKIQRYYRMSLFDGIAKIIASLMQMLHKAIPSWGICIILTSSIVYFSMYPLTMRGMISMKRMQSLQPMIAKLKEKHKDNPQKMNKEMMELYKEHKVNPLGGCLPMLLQMPVFIGLYQVLWRSVDFKGASFLWMKDLSQPDRLFILPFSLPILGNEVNLLPLIMMIVMFFQQKLSAKNMVVSDPSQAAQQKMMSTIMPIFLGFIFYKFASGLTLYFTMFYFFSTFTQWKMSRPAKVQ